MKKIVSSLLAAVLTVSFAGSVVSFADGYTGEIPSVYFKAKENSSATIGSDGSITIDRSALASGNTTFTIEVYIKDNAVPCFDVNPKWKSDSSFIELDNLVDPSETEDFSYAYGAKNYSINVSNDKQYNTMGFKCSTGFSLGSLETLGETSEDYPLTAFDIKVSPNTPYGQHEIFFLSESIDYPDQRVSEIAIRTDDGKEYVVKPNMQSISVNINGFNLGDVDNDGSVTASDASAALAAYSKASTTVDASTGLSELETLAADTDGDGMVTSVDASNILAYYVRSSTQKEVCTFTEFMDEIKNVK